jgi:hypothetical protein
VGAALSAADRARHARRLAPARAALGEAAFANAWQEGRAAPLEDIVAQALNASSPLRKRPG